MTSIRAYRVETHDGRIIWRGVVIHKGLTFDVEENHASELEALRAADQARKRIIEGLTPAVLADMDRRANAPNKPNIGASRYD